VNESCTGSEDADQFCAAGEKPIAITRTEPDASFIEPNEKFPSGSVLVEDVKWRARRVTSALLIAAPLPSRTEPEIVSCCAPERSDKTKGNMRNEKAATEQRRFGDLESREGKSSSCAEHEQAWAGRSKYP
jgi:hypothetical protein